MYGLTEWLSLLTCAGQATLIALALSRGGRTELGQRLIALSVVLLGWNFAFLAYRTSGLPIWHLIDVSISPWTTPTALHLVLAFVGERRRFRAALAITYASFGALSAVSAGGLFAPALLRFGDSPAWSLAHAALEVPVVLFAASRLAVYRRAAAPGDRRRAWIVLTALAVMAAASATELSGGFGLHLPQLGNLGSLVSASLFSLATLRFRLLDQPYRLGGGRESRARLAFLGRASAQMAHDLKNPLAALRAMVQYLEGEIAAGRSIDGELPRLALMRGQIDRLSGVVDKYRRVGAVDPVRGPLDLDAVVRGVVETARFDTTITLELELGEGLPRCHGDVDLLAAALENLVRNAVEAAGDARAVAADDPARGRVTVRTRAAPPGRVLVEVEDDGPGIQANVREKIFDDFFTTKAQGSGLGLGFVWRVITAHHGDVALTSAPSGGSIARLWLPVG